ncbi:hypothetical protein [Novosphingopyxis sp.]|uniref:hypothetical protein n=1 Tax=Novosphingopyxis sp. TaxID=2709690 RepID=UPI003B5C890E
MNFDKAQQNYRSRKPSAIGRGIEKLTRPLSAILSHAIPSSLLEKIARGIDSAATQPSLTSLGHDISDLHACHEASRKIETRAKAMNAATGMASGFAVR